MGLRVFSLRATGKKARIFFNPMAENSISSDRNRADALIREGRYEEAIEIYRRLTEARPEEDSHLLTREGFHPLASEAFTKAVAAEPENPRFLLHLAASYTARDLVDLAAAALRRAEVLTGSAFGKPRPAAG